jgi:hypothetical protein
MLKKYVAYSCLFVFTFVSFSFGAGQRLLHPGLDFTLAPESIASRCKDSLAATEGRLNDLITLETNRRSFENTIVTFDQVLIDLGDELAAAVFLKYVSPDEKVRGAAHECETKLETFFEADLQERLARPQNWREMCKVTMSNTRVITSQSISTAGDWAATGALTRGTAFDPTDVAEVADTLTISTGHHVTTYFDFADLAQSPWTTEKEIWGRAGERIGERIEIEVLAQHASWRNLGGSAGAWTDNTDVVLAASAANIDDLARLIRRVIREQNGASLMARNGVGVVVSPTTFEFVEAFAQAEKIIGLIKSLLIGLNTLFQRATRRKQELMFCAA